MSELGGEISDLSLHLPQSQSLLLQLASLSPHHCCLLTQLLSGDTRGQVKLHNQSISEVSLFQITCKNCYNKK